VERLTQTTNPAAAARRARGGYTLAEGMIASVVLAAAVVGIAGTLCASYQQTAVRGNTTTALALAQQLMEEIAARPFDLPEGQPNKPGWAGGETDRRQYDTVDDYNGYTDLSGSVQTIDGTLVDLGDGAAYTRTVSVQAGYQPAGLTGPASDFLLVTVTVAMPRSNELKISQLFTRTTMFR
jgi:Tfp pilus assembly major pilin PilA